jgi:hypothetical protein
MRIINFMKRYPVGLVLLEANQRVSRNKFAELELTWHKKAWCWGGLWMSWTCNSDHAGIRLAVCLYKLDFEFNLYDHRHWDDGKDQWEECPDDCDLKDDNNDSKS